MGALELKGKAFGKLKVLCRTARPFGIKSSNSYWLARCSCGNITTVSGTKLTQGRTKSCGCLRSEMSRARLLKSGITGHDLENIYYGIKQRCYNKKLKAYKNYGGRGIVMCKRWFCSFNAFCEDMGPRPTKEHTIERVNNNEIYEPNNCIWILKKDQSKNRRGLRWITSPGGDIKTMTEWCRLLNISKTTVYSRIRRGLKEWKALTLKKGCKK